MSPQRESGVKSGTADCPSVLPTEGGAEMQTQKRWVLRVTASEQHQKRSGVGREGKTQRGQEEGQPQGVFFFWLQHLPSVLSFPLLC